MPTDAVRVSVRSLTGDAVPGAVVELFPGPDSGETCDDDKFRPSAKPVAPVRTIPADAAGAALFDATPQGRWFVAAYAPGHGRRSIQVTRGERGADVEVLLDSGGSFVGSLRDEAGAPMPKVDVILAPTQRSMVWPSDASCLRTTTDDAGAWSFDGVAAGEYRVWVRAEPEALLDEGRVRVPALDRFDIRLPRGALIEGVVTDADSGRVLPGVRVNLRSDDSDDPDLGWIPCDAAGRFRHLTRRGEAEVDSVRVAADGYVPIPVDGSGDVHQRKLRDGQVVRLAVRARRGFVVTGLVIGPEGPLAGVDVTVAPESEKEAGFVDGRRAKTDATGRYRFERVPAGPAEIRSDPFAPHRYGSTEVKRAVLVGDVAVTTADVVVAAKSVVASGRVIDAEGSPIEGAQVGYGEGVLASQTVTGTDGTFSLSVWLLPDEEFPAIAVTADGFEREWAEVPPGGGACEDVELRPLKSDHGSVLDADGKAVAGARVSVDSGEVGQEVFIFQWPGAVETATDARGIFDVAASTGNEEMIRALAPRDGTSWNWRSWHPGPSGERDIRLRRVVRVKGRVVATDTRAPVTNAIVRCWWYSDQDDAPAVGRTDADGRFDVPYEPPENSETHGLRVEAAGYREQTLTPGDADALVELVPALAITGSLVDADGRPIADQEVRAWQSGVQDAVAVTDESTTDSDGRFMFPALPTGRYELTARWRDDAFEDIEVEVVASTRDVVVRASKSQTPAAAEPPKSSDHDGPR